MTRAVIFDFGDVMFRVSWPEVNKLFSERNGFDILLGDDPDKELREIYLNLHLGKEDFRNFLLAINPNLKEFDKAINDYKEAYSKKREMNGGILGMINGLKRGGIRVFGFTDTQREHYEANLESGLCDNFERVFTSFEFGHIKTEKAAFEMLADELKKLGISPSECIFVDDRAKNTETARESGFNAILYPDFPETEKLEKEIYEKIGKS